MEFLYPGGKTNLEFISGEDTSLNLKSRFDRWKTLFKGGLFVRFYKLADERNIARIVARHSKLAWPSRTFICAENARSEAALSHVSTGLMEQFDCLAEGRIVNTAVIGFIVKLLNWNENKGCGARNPAPGAFVVLLGLDGSGKTTIARELCCRAATAAQFQSARYFHWRPTLSRKAVFPFSTTENIPRKPARQNGIFMSLLSSLRIFKNLALTKLAWAFRVKGKLRNGTLVIMDRYFYNYYLDPASVRYYGPSGLVDKLRDAFPQPDLIVVLKAPMETLLNRKQELSAEEIQRQSAILEKISRETASSMCVDATRPASEIAREIFSRLASMRGIEPNFRRNFLIK
jgi:thymidylate kinase